jgi:hypothetical protein
VRARGSDEVLFGFVELEKARQAGQLMRSLRNKSSSFKSRIWSDTAVTGRSGISQWRSY